MAATDWSRRSFAYYPTDAIVLSRCIGGVWSTPEVTGDFKLNLHCFAGVFHYAPSCFEGLKAYQGADGRVRLFRPHENAARMAAAARYLDMPTPPAELFVELCIRCVQANWNHIPPYGTEASLYLRPVLFGINPQLGIKSPDDVMLVVMASAIGTYSGAKSLTPGTAVLSRNYDRAATFGSGGYKIGANYAQSLHAYNVAHGKGYRELLFLDSATHTRIEEFGSSNFFAIKDGRYITPDSASILPSITNKSLRRVAEDAGLQVERRPVAVEELETFEEVNACGTAVVITPICRIDDKTSLESGEVTRSWHFGRPDRCSPVSEMLYRRLVRIQKGIDEDPYDWCLIIHPIM
ncbi:MAG: branched-chain amino acid aminotransferase [Bacteroidales bacterium]|nr:branched-chain amino acid aminotransferase [Bacteroidales bacterium]